MAILVPPSLGNDLNLALVYWDFWSLNESFGGGGSHSLPRLFGAD